MSALSEHVEQLSRIQDAALDQMQRLVQLMADHFKRQDAEMAELRDELLALSNRIEAVTRAAVGSGLHSVKAPDDGTMRDGSVCPRCGVHVFRPGHACHVSRANYVVA